MQQSERVKSELDGPAREAAQLRMLIVEDDPASRQFLRIFLALFGDYDTAADGEEALQHMRRALEDRRPYDLVCLDIMMPNMDGREALRGIRCLEEEHGIRPGDGAKVIMTTSVANVENVMGAFRDQCEAYLIKPIDEERLVEKMKELRLI